MRRTDSKRTKPESAGIPRSKNRQPRPGAAVLLALALFCPGLHAEGESARAPGIAAVEAGTGYQGWLELVSPLMNERERNVFLSLEEAYQRDAFIRRFWQVRDPFPGTGHNEFRRRWEERLRLARERYADPEEDRAQMLVLVGEPDEQTQIACSRIVLPLEIWYFEARDEIGSAFYLVFWAQSRHGRYELWDSNQGLSQIHDDFMKPGRKRHFDAEQLLNNRRGAPARDPESPAEIPEGSPDLWSQQADLFDEILLQCPRGELIISALRLAIDPRLIRERFQPVPEPAEGWADRFFAHLAATGTEARRVPTHELLSELQLEPRIEVGQAFPRLAPVFVSPTAPAQEAAAAEDPSTGGW